MQAVRFDRYGSVDELYLTDVPTPSPAAGEVLIQVVTTSINPGEILIREGAMHEQVPAHFPSGQGSDLAGRVAAVGAGVDNWQVGAEVIGWTDERAAQAEYVTVPVSQLTHKPSRVSWEQAACLYVAGCTACGMVDAAVVKSREMVVVSAAAGGVGSIAVQLLRHLDAHVLGIAGAGNLDWLASLGVAPIGHGDGLEDRLRQAAPNGIDALLDCYGGGYVDSALHLGVPADRIVTIVDFDAAEKHGVTTVFGANVATPDMLARLADMIDNSQLTIPIAATYPIDQVRQAYNRLAERHTRGKIVLNVAS